jgi:hypothetical protein
MGLAINGPWYLSTPTNNLFVNQANASFSCWVWVPPMSGGLANGFTNYVFTSDGVGPGTGAGIAVASSGGPNNWTTLARNVGASSVCEFKASTNLASMENPGGVYHIALTWTSGTQKVWVNGASQSLAFGGAISGNTNSTNLAWWLGLEAAGVPNNTIIWLSQPAIWQGYVLTSSDVSLLYSAAPGSQVPINNTLGQNASAFWPLNGTIGVVPTTSDTAIQNAGSLGAGTGNEYNFTTISSSAYGAAVYCPDLNSGALPALNWQAGDSFSGVVTGTDISGRTSTGIGTAATWAKQSGFSTGSIVGQTSGLNNYVRRANSNAAVYYLDTPAPAGIDALGRFDFYVESNIVDIPAIAFLATSNNTLAAARWSQSALEMQITRTISGTTTIDASSSAISALTSGNTYTLEGYVTGNGNITAALYLGSAQLAYVTYADGGNIAANGLYPGYVGLEIAGGGADSSSAGLWITNLRFAYGPPVIDLTFGGAALATTLNNGNAYAYVDIPAICGTPNYLLCTCEARTANQVSSGGVNAAYRDIVLWQQSRASGAAAAPSVLVNAALAETNVCQNLVMCYVPGTGTVVALYVEYPSGYYEATATSSNPATIKLITSSNQGTTWSSPTDISSQIMQSGWASCFLGPGNGLIVMQNGNLGLVLSATTAANYTNVRAWFFTGNPAGTTWTIGGQIGTTQAGGGSGVAYGESKVCQLSNGNLLAWLRPSGAGSTAVPEVWYTSSNGGSTWSSLSPTDNPQIPACTVGLITDANGNVWHSYPNSQINTQARQYQTVSYSTNGGATFSIPQLSGYNNFPQGSLIDGNANANTVYGNGTGYSALYADPSTGLLWCLYERVWPGQTTPYSLSLAQISPAWVGGPSAQPAVSSRGATLATCM